MNRLRVGPSRTQLFRCMHANTMEEAIQIALQEEYSHRQARTPTSVWQGHNAPSGAVQGAPAAGASTGLVPMELGTAEQSSIVVRMDMESSGTSNVTALRKGNRNSLPNLRARKVSGKSHDKASGELGSSVGVISRGGAPYWGKSKSPWGVGGARFVPESLGALETRTSSGGLLVVHASTVARNSDKFADALRDSEGRGQISVRLADGTVVNVPAVRMDLAVKFENFDSTKAGNVVPQTAEAVKEDAKGVSSVGTRVPRRVKKTSTRAEVSLSTSRADNQVPHLESETPPGRPVEDQYHVFDGVSGRQVRAGVVHLEALPEVSALLNLEELSMKDFLAGLNAGDIVEMVLLIPLLKN
ncbi:LOW QUALITY PROTEIN: Gag protein [Phytophthora palmivora]|uniref:Gag protein n=1 Tax=Phytophthora palmivora TaxID=4796 RepID=A0A2P4XAF7_9STRA|nr:LOW QUALITY PROTEIN: Gag protein [Phytophthora palmivora]